MKTITGEPNSLSRNWFLSRRGRLAVWFLAAALTAATVGMAAEEIEIKFVVKEGAKSYAKAWEKLDGGGKNLSKEDHIDEQVGFFEDETASIGTKTGLILRARRKQAGQEAPTADSTVKVRLGKDTPKPGPKEEPMPKEKDWTGTDTVNTSRAVDWKPKDGEGGPDVTVFDEVMKGRSTAEPLFMGPAQAAKPPKNGKPGKPAIPSQQELIKERTGTGINWGLLRRYGPISAKVWKEKYKLSDSFDKVTVEDWVLERQGKETVHLLELSIKVEVADDAAAKAKVAEFFAAAQAEFGEPDTISKTKRALEYYAPGILPLEGGVKDVSKITPNLKDGDMVFVQSHSTQAATLRMLTGSHMTHCGILFKDAQGKWRVYEGAGINAPSYKTLADWKVHELSGNDGELPDPNIYVRRVKTESGLSKTQIESLKKAAAAMHATKYDGEFGWGDKLIYCSELVYKAYDKALAIPLVKLQTYGDLLKKPGTAMRLEQVKTEKAAKMKELLKSEKKQAELVVSPGDLVYSEKLEVVRPVGQQP